MEKLEEHKDTPFAIPKDLIGILNQIISRQDKIEECIKYLAAEMYLLGLGEEGRNYSDKINQILSE